MRWLKAFDNPDFDSELFAFQDSQIEPIPKQIQTYDRANYVGMALERSGDIFRELVGRSISEAYITEKVTRMGWYWNKTFWEIEPEAKQLCENLASLWEGLNLEDKSERLLAARDLNVALSRQDKLAAEDALSRGKI